MTDFIRGDFKMLYNFLDIDKKSDVPLWRQLRESIARALSEGRIEVGSRLPSIRDLAGELGVSRSPVENAYVQMQIDGLIESRPKSGFFALSPPENTGDAVLLQRNEAPLRQARYDFRGGRVDAKTADIDIWRRHLRIALNKQDEIISNGDPQGEPELREALVGYCYTARGVSASADRIVIASGTQQLLAALCRILGRSGRAVMERPGFAQAEQIFLDFGWDVHFLDGDKDDRIAEELKDRAADLFADITSNRPQVPVSKLSRRRKQILEWAAQNGKYVLEDDYNGELRYVSRPVPSLQGLAPEHVIYIGSFSRLLLPSVRIAYMVLPKKLTEAAKDKSSLYDQTSSKIEQLALAEYIRERHLERHLRRSRKIYQMKSRALLSALSGEFGSDADCVLLETSLAVALSLHTDAGADELADASKRAGILIEPLHTAESGFPSVLLSFSGIPPEDIGPAVHELKAAWSDFI